jgi:F-type H+-transporting ATPase subunit delta
LIGSKVTKRYAKALLSLGQEDGHFEKYGMDLQDFSGFCEVHKEVLGVIANQIFPVEDRRKILQTLLKTNNRSL